MKLKMTLLGLVVGGILTTAAEVEKPWLDSTLTEGDRVEMLLKVMTLKEKIGQLNQSHFGRNSNPNNVTSTPPDAGKGVSGSILYMSESPETRNALQRHLVTKSRLGIPAIFGYDVIHGLKTIFPVPLAQGASFNPALTKSGCAVAAEESCKVGIDWTFSPMIDIGHDPRWGRVVEGYGEDPWLTSVFAVAAVQGYQGDSRADLKRPDKVAACLKHFAGYGASEGGRDYHYTSIPLQELFDIYLPPYKAGVDAGAVTIMSAFNDISGAPASANNFLETEVLRNRWKFDGFIVSDWASVVQLINQGFAKDAAEASERALKAGTDMDMVDGLYIAHLEKLVENGQLPVSVIDESVRRILRIKFRKGLFDNPYVTVYPETERFLKPEYRALAKQSAIESFVLLENKNELLPLDVTKVKTIALVGPGADDDDGMNGSWVGHGNPKDVITLKAALEKQYGSRIKIIYEKGCDYTAKTTDFTKVLNAAEQADVTIACLGEPHSWSGENRSRSGIYLPGSQNEMITALKKTGKPVVSLLFTGRPLELRTVKENSDAMMIAWYPGTEAGNALTDVLFGVESPSGKLTISFPEYVGQIPVHYRRRPPSRHSPIGDYIDGPTKPLYTFGDGKTYTEFKYSNLRLDRTVADKNTTIKATVTVTNTGKKAAKETVLWFINDPYATHNTRPIKELKHFSKSFIKPGESIDVTFEINAGTVFSYPDADGKMHFDAGDIHLMVGNLKTKIECVE